MHLIKLKMGFLGTNSTDRGAPKEFFFYCLSPCIKSVMDEFGGENTCFVFPNPFLFNSYFK